MQYYWGIDNLLSIRSVDHGKVGSSCPGSWVPNPGPRNKFSVFFQNVIILYSCSSSGCNFWPIFFKICINLPFCNSFFRFDGQQNIIKFSSFSEGLPQTFDLSDPNAFFGEKSPLLLSKILPLYCLF